MKKKKADPSAILSRNPFPGLRPYGEGEARWFFGRSQETRELLDRLTYHRFVAVIGSSGCGKSSLVRASLVPALRAGYNSTTPDAWRIATLRPGNDPISSLAGALKEVLYPAKARSVGRKERIMKELLAGSLGIVRVLREAGLPEGGKLLILVDQFEELFTIAEKNRDLSQGEIRDFVQLLIDAAWNREYPIHILITMRSENIGLCSRFGDLARVINDGLFLVPRLPSSRLREVIEYSVEQKIDPALVTRLINDLSGGTDDLPLLQHALMRLWDARAKRDAEAPISLDDLDRVGAIGKTIGNQIEEEILRPLEVEGKGEDKELIFGLFLEITEVGDDGQMNRQPKRFDELCRRLGSDPDRLKLLIDRFRVEGRSFLQPSYTDVPVLDQGTLIDVSHESLIRQWEDLRLRARERKQFLDEIDLFEKTASDWERHGNDSGGLLPGGRRLGRAVELLKLRPLDFSVVAKEFVDMSLQEATRVVTQKRTWRIASVAALVGLLSFVAFFIHFEQLKTATANSIAAAAKAEAAAADDRRTAAETNAKLLVEKEKVRTAEAEASAAQEKALAREKVANAEFQRIADKEANDRQRIAEKEANDRQLREIEIARQRELVEMQLKENRNREAMISLVTISYQALLGTRGYSDADRQLKNFSDETIHYLGEEISRAQVKEIVVYEARVWPIRKFTTLAKPQVDVSATLEEGTINAYFHYEYRRATDQKVAPDEGPGIAAGYFKETCRFQIGADLMPVLVSLDRAAVSRAELRDVVSRDFERLVKDQGVEVASFDEEIAKNRFWQHVMEFQEGTVITAPEVQVSGAGTLQSTGMVYRFPIPGSGSEPIGWLRSEITVNVSSGAYTSAEKKDDDFSTVPAPLTSPSADPVIAPGIPATDSSAPGSREFPWPRDYQFVKKVEELPSRDSVLYGALKKWEDGTSTLSSEEIARLAGELYILCSNPNPIREQSDFYSASIGKERVRLYYDEKEKSHSSILKDLESYKKKLPERTFQVAPDSARVVELTTLDQESENEVTVRVPFGFKADSSSISVSMGADITFLVLPRRWPVITHISTAPKDLNVTLPAPEASRV